MLVHRCVLLKPGKPALRTALRVAAISTMGKKQANPATNGQPKQDGKTKQKQQQPQQKQQQRFDKPAGGMQHYSSFLQVLATDIDHTSPSVLLFFDKERYLFNAGEGIQRLFREHRLKVKQITSYFVTRISTETLGGLPGMALSVVPAEGGGLIGKQVSVSVKGPPGLEAYVEAFRSYINQENTVAVEEIDPNTDQLALKTDVVSITPIVIRMPSKRKENQNGGRSCTALHDSTEKVCTITSPMAESSSGPAVSLSPPSSDDSPMALGEEVVTIASEKEKVAAEGGVTKAVEAMTSDGDDSQSPVAKRRRTECEGGDVAGPTGVVGEDEEVGPLAVARRTEEPEEAQDGEGRQRPAGVGHSDIIVYAVQLAGRPGKFLPAKAKELGVPYGPSYGELQRGLCVTLDDGRVVRPEEVSEPAVPGPSVLLLDTPSKEHLEAVAADERVRRFVNEAAAAAAANVSGPNNRLCVAVHLAPPSLAADAATLASWRSSLGPSWRHLLVTPGSQQPSSIPRATVFQAKLHAIDPTCFPLFALDNSAAPPALPEAELAAVAAATQEAAAKALLPVAKAAGGGNMGGRGGGRTGKGGKGQGDGGSGGGGKETAAGAPGGELAVAAVTSSVAATVPAAAVTSSAAARPAAAAAVLMVVQQPPVLPVAPGSVVHAMSAVRYNLVPPARQGLEYGDVFKYDSSSKVLEELRANPAFAEALAAAAKVRQPVTAETTTETYDGSTAVTAAEVMTDGDVPGASKQLDVEMPDASLAAELEAPDPTTVAAVDVETVANTTAADATAAALAPAEVAMVEVVAGGGSSGDGGGGAVENRVSGEGGVGGKVEATGTMPVAAAAPTAADGGATPADEQAEGVVGAPEGQVEEKEQSQGEQRVGVVREEVVPEPVARGDRTLLELTFLGTASSQPSKFRNVSGCYVDLFSRGGLLVDCGEDALGQMKRRFGVVEAESRLGEGLHLVWISHMHADHHGGLYRLLEWRARRGCGPLVVVGPKKLFEVLIKYSAVIPINFIFVPNSALSSAHTSRRPPPQLVLDALAAATDRLGLSELLPFPVDHIWDAHGLLLVGRDGWRVVFSGDTRPCEQTVAAARGATLLVHEATFEESMGAEARTKKHSTTAEAVAVGERAGAYRTLLTHFSTRYPTLPELDLTPHPTVGVAMDLMALNLADLPVLPRLVGPLGLLFKQLEEEKLAAEGDEDD